MLRLLLISIFITIFYNSNSQTLTTFRKNYSYSLVDISGGAIESLNSGNYITAGTLFNFFVRGQVTEIGDTGQVIWSNTYSDGSWAFELNDIKSDIALNGYYLGGGSSSNDAIFMRINSTGAPTLSKQFGITQADGAYFKSIQKTSDGGYICVGYVTGHAPGGGETYFASQTCVDDEGDSHTESFGSPLIVKLDSNGNHLWHKIFRYYDNVAKNTTDRIYNDASLNDVIEVADGFIAVGNYDVRDWDPNTASDCNDRSPLNGTILKTDLSGNIVYHYQYDNYSSTAASKSLNALTKSSSGDPIAAGLCNGSNEWILKFSSSDAYSMALSKRYVYPGGLSTVEINDVHEVPGSTDIVTMGMYINFLTFTNSIHKIDQWGTELWTKYYTQSLATLIPRGSPTSDGGYIMQSMSMGGGFFSNHVIKTDSQGDVDLIECPPTAITPSSNTGPTTIVVPFYNVFTGTVKPQTINMTASPISPGVGYVCTEPLPVELAYFDGIYDEGANKLVWQTLTERNSSHFNLYRSIDGINWDEIGNVKSHGNSTSPINYNYDDIDFRNGINYYKLRQVDFDGKFEEYKMIAINNTKSSIKIVRITDILGRDIDENYQGVKIYFFEDGSKLYKY